MESIYEISVQSIQELALNKIGRILTTEELLWVQRGIEKYIEIYYDDMITSSFEYAGLNINLKNT